MGNATVSYESAQDAVKVTCVIDGKTWTNLLYGDFRSPYSPWVIQIIRREIATWNDGTPIDETHRVAIWNALQANPPGECEFRET